MNLNNRNEIDLSVKMLVRNFVSSVYTHNFNEKFLNLELEFEDWYLIIKFIKINYLIYRKHLQADLHFR